MHYGDSRGLATTLRFCLLRRKVSELENKVDCLVAKLNYHKSFPDNVREVEDVSVGVGVGRLVGLQGEGAVVEGQPAEVHVVGVVEAPRRLLAAPLVLPFCGGDVAAARFSVLNLLY